MKRILTLFAFLLFFSCSPKLEHSDKLRLLEAEQDSPTGKLVLQIFADSSFTFASTGMAASTYYKGKAKIEGKSIEFISQGKNVRLGKKAKLENGKLRFMNGEYRKPFKLLKNKLEE